MSTELFDRGVMDRRRQSYELNKDAVAGLKAAVNNGQTRLALEYTEVLVSEILDRLDSLENHSTKKSVESVVAPQKQAATQEVERKPRATKQAAKEVDEQTS